MKLFRYLIEKCAVIIATGKEERESKYEVISHEENFDGTGHIYAKVRLRGIRKTFFKPITELYKKEWLNDFSREDGAFIAVLFLAEQQKDPELMELFPRKKQQITPNVIFLGMMFVSFLILSNLTASKIVEFKFSSLNFLPFLNTIDFNFPAALIFFPLTYFFDDNLTEVYGFQISRFIIWGGLICNTLVTLGILTTIHLNPSHYWSYQDQYATVFGSTFRVFIASALGYFVGEFCNSIILSKMKIMTSGRWLWLRIISSTSVAVGIDSIIFCNIAFFGKLPPNIIFQMIFIQYAFKVGYELLALPLTYLITGYLKKKDRVDYYDYTTKFNPFSLKIDHDRLG